jgi:hypothetical protein
MPRRSFRRRRAGRKAAQKAVPGVSAAPAQCPTGAERTRTASTKAAAAAAGETIRAILVNIE